MEPITYKYTFEFSEDSSKEFIVHLNPTTLDMINKADGLHPEWTRLECFQCPCCPLDKESSPYCPIALNLVEIIDFFSRSLSFSEADITVECDNRTYFKRTSLQYGLSSLIGIYMVTSGCPVLEKLKPMVRYHLPFASPEETNYRVITMYLTAQHFIAKNGGTPDYTLSGLVSMYHHISEVNVAFCQRLTNMDIEDAALNALVNLNCFATIVSLSIAEDLLQELEALFSSYL